MAKRIDANQPIIVDALRRAGCTVAVMSAAGKGFPDLVVGRHGVTYLMEIKDGEKSPSKRKLTPDEETWHSAWDGHVAVVESIEDALATVGLA